MMNTSYVFDSYEIFDSYADLIEEISRFFDISTRILTPLVLAIAMVGILGNVLVLFIIFKHHEMQTVTNYYIANLAAADVLTLSACALPTAIAMRALSVPPFMCKLVAYLMNVSVQANCLTLTTMTIDRYNIIVHAVRSRRTRSTKKALRSNILIWIVCVLLHLPTLWINGNNPIGRCEPMLKSLAAKVIFHVHLTFAMYFGPLLVILICYVRILIQVWKTSSRGTESAEAHERSIRRKRRITRMVFIVVLVFAVCWFPAHVMRLWVSFTSRVPYDLIKNYKVVNIGDFFSLVLMYSNSLINPFIYAYATTSFRRLFKQTLCSCWSKNDFTGLSNGAKTITSQRCVRDGESD